LGRELSARDTPTLAQWIFECAPGRLIITGGEPLLQQNKLTALLKAVDTRRHEATMGRLVIEVETNGTVMPTEQLLGRVDQWNVSPKLGNSGVPLSRRIRPPVLCTFRDAGAFFKFVVRSRDDVAEVGRLERELELSVEQVLLMPEAASKWHLKRRAPDVEKWAKERAYRYSGRLHLELFDGRRGA
jgi:organic radical activating enzyme